MPIKNKKRKVKKREKIKKKTLKKRKVKVSKLIKTRANLKTKKKAKTLKKTKVGKKIKAGKIKKTRPRIFRAVLRGERVVSKSKEAFDLYGKSRFGEIISGKVYYPFVEAGYLLEKKKLQIFDNKKKLNFDSFFEKAGNLEPQFWTRYCVFKNMRNRGYIVKTALKFGADFRVYDRGIKPGEAHAKWILFPVYETSSLTWHEFAAKNRVAHSTRKDLLIAVVDDSGDVSYWEVRWTKP